MESTSAFPLGQIRTKGTAGGGKIILMFLHVRVSRRVMRLPFTLKKNPENVTDGRNAPLQPAHSPFSLIDVEIH